MTFVKICGVRTAETALHAARAGADFIGLVFAESRRRVSVDEACLIAAEVQGCRRGVPALSGPAAGEVSGWSWFSCWAEAAEEALHRGRPLLVGVFADQEPTDINRICRAVPLDLVQIAGPLGPEAIEKVELPVIRVHHVDSSVDQESILEEVSAGGGAFCMLDTSLGKARGGTGQTFDWQIAKPLAERMPFFLAGGLTPDNVVEAIGTAAPWAVDVSSGVETLGQKDPEKISAFVRAARTQP